MAELAVGYVLKGYPRMSELFIASEIWRMEQLGVPLRLYVVKPADETSHHPVVDRIAVVASYLPPTTPLSGQPLLPWLRRNLPAYRPALLRMVRRRPLRLARTIGTAGAQASEPTGFITVRVPTALIGGVPGPGWRFTVVLHGQDGFGQDGARTFADTPQPFQFGRCATAGDPEPRCAVPLDQLPKAMDVLVPAGATQAEVLDPTRPVVLRGIPMT